MAPEKRRARARSKAKRRRMIRAGLRFPTFRQHPPDGTPIPDTLGLSRAWAAPDVMNDGIPIAAAVLGYVIIQEALAGVTPDFNSGDALLQSAVTSLQLKFNPPSSRWPICCLITGNPCGTDTWAVEQPCRCGNCTIWVAAYADPRFSGLLR